MEEGQEGAQEAPGADENGAEPPSTGEAGNGAHPDLGRSDNSEPETFSREYVEGLRAEAAEHRTRAKRADELSTRLLDLTIREGTRGILQDPDDVWRDRDVDDFTDEDGFPSVDKVREIAEALAKERPHLAYRRPTGSVDQGARQEPPRPPNLADMLRSRAG